MNSAGVLYVPAADGNLYMFDADTGQLIYKRFFGTSLVVLPTIGKTVEGKSRLMVITGGREAAIIGGITPQNVPGALMSFGLPDNYVQPKPLQKVPEAPKASKDAPKDVQKEAAKEEPKEISSQASPILYMVAGVSVVIVAVALVIRTRTSKK